MSATFSSSPDEGMPLLMSTDDLKIVDGLQGAGQASTT